MFPQIWWLRTKENDSLPVLEPRSPKSKCQQDTHTAEALGRALPCLFQGPVASGGARLAVAPLQSLPPPARGHLPHLFVFDLALLSLSLSLSLFGCTTWLVKCPWAGIELMLPAVATGEVLSLLPLLWILVIGFTAHRIPGWSHSWFHLIISAKTLFP